MMRKSCLKEDCSIKTKLCCRLLQEEIFNNLIVLTCLIERLDRYIKTPVKPLGTIVDIANLSIEQILMQLSEVKANDVADWIFATYENELIEEDYTFFKEKDFSKNN